MCGYFTVLREFIPGEYREKQRTLRVYSPFSLSFSSVLTLPPKELQGKGLTFEDHRELMGGKLGKAWLKRWGNTHCPLYT